MDKELGVRAEGCSLTSLFSGGWKFSVFVRLTVPPQLPALTPPTLVARRVGEKQTMRTQYKRLFMASWQIAGLILIAYLMSGVVSSLKSSIESSNVWYLSIPAYTVVWLLLSLLATKYFDLDTISLKENFGWRFTKCAVLGILCHCWISLGQRP